MPQNEHSRYRGLRVCLCIALILSLLLCTWLMSGAVAYGWILHADSYGAPFAAYGRWMLILCGGMTAAVLLYLLRRDLPAAVLGSLCYLPMLVITLRAINTAEISGWAGQTEAHFGVQAAAVWRNGLMWNLLTLILLLILTLTRYFSDSARSSRAERKRQAENEPAPSILAENPHGKKP